MSRISSECRVIEHAYHVNVVREPMPHELELVHAEAIRVFEVSNGQDRRVLVFEARDTFHYVFPFPAGPSDVPGAGTRAKCRAAIDARVAYWNDPHSPVLGTAD